MSVSISIPRFSSSRSPNEAEFPFLESKPLDGIISYLTRKHGGNVHDKGIVTITSESLGSYGVRYASDLNSGSSFCSKNGPGQWICWDFHELRIRPTHYTIKSEFMTSWVVESSMDGVNWTPIDRKKDHRNRYGASVESFAVANSAQCRFIRLTQTGKNCHGDDRLCGCAFEFFGTLLE
jgi:hypothetical protein